MRGAAQSGVGCIAVPGLIGMHVKIYLVCLDYRREYMHGESVLPVAEVFSDLEFVCDERILALAELDSVEKILRNAVNALEHEIDVLTLSR